MRLSKNFSRPKNLVQIADDGLLPFVEAMKKIDQTAETYWSPLGGVYAPFQNIRRKSIAGYRFYECDECGYSGKQKTRDCHSPSHELCEKCNSEASITGHEEHPEWPVDKSGNLV